MNEEEKQAIEFIKKELEDEKDGYLDYKELNGLYGNYEIEIILNLIYKQQKEIDKCEYYKDHADLFLEENKKLKKEIEGLKEKSYYLPASCNPNYISKDKIKEKIEEYKKKCRECIFQNSRFCENLKKHHNCSIQSFLELLKELLGE